MACFASARRPPADRPLRRRAQESGRGSPVAAHLSCRAWARPIWPPALSGGGAGR